MAKKYKVCKQCGLLLELDVKECPVDSTNVFVEKYKGTIIVLDAKKSDLAQKLNITNNGMYALKY